MKMRTLAPSLIVYLTPHLHKALPRILEKITQSGARILAMTETLEQASALDQVLWTYTPLSFLAHGCQGKDGDPENHPLWITTQDTLENANNGDVLALVDIKNVPGILKKFQKIVLILSPEDKDSALDFIPQCSQVTFWSQTPEGWKSLDDQAESQ